MGDDRLPETVCVVVPLAPAATCLGSVPPLPGAGGGHAEGNGIPMVVDVGVAVDAGAALLVDVKTRILADRFLGGAACAGLEKVLKILSEPETNMSNRTLWWPDGKPHCCLNLWCQLRCLQQTNLETLGNTLTSLIHRKDIGDSLGIAFTNLTGRRNDLILIDLHCIAAGGRCRRGGRRCGC